MYFVTIFLYSIIINLFYKTNSMPLLLDRVRGVPGAAISLKRKKKLGQIKPPESEQQQLPAPFDNSLILSNFSSSSSFSFLRGVMPPRLPSALRKALEAYCQFSY